MVHAGDVRRRLYVLVNRVVNGVLRRTGVSTFRGAKLLYLTTTGRVSGSRRTVPLAFVPDGDDLVVAASNGGADWEPGWWLNLQADPRGTIEVDKQQRAVTASEVDGPEREVLWARLGAQLDSYDGYQAKVARRIAVVRLTPVTPAGS